MTRQFWMTIGALFAAILPATPAVAAKKIDLPPVVPCQQGIILNAVSCATESGNLNNNSPAANQARANIWSSLGNDSIGQSLWISGNKIEFGETPKGATFSFALPLSGISYLAIHWGGGSANDGGPGNATVFYKLDAGSGVSALTTNFRGISNAALYSTSVPAVPEPATWAMFLIGIGAVGFVMRRRRTAGRIAAPAM